MNERLRALGTHLLLEMNECNATLLDDVELVKRALLDAAAEAGRNRRRRGVPQVFAGRRYRHCLHCRIAYQHSHLARARLCRRGHLHLWREPQAHGGGASHCQIACKSQHCNVMEVKRGVVNAHMPTAIRD